MDKYEIDTILERIQEDIEKIKREKYRDSREYLKGRAIGLALALRIAKALPEEEIEQLMNEILFL